MFLRKYTGGLQGAASERRTDPAAAGRSERHRPLIAAAAGAMALLASLLNYVSHHGYPLGAPEIRIAAAMLVVFAVAVGLLYAVSGRIGRMILEILLTYLMFDLNFDGVGVAIATVGTVIVLNRHLLHVMAVAFPVVIAADVIGIEFDDANVQAGAVALPAVESNAPVLLHMILDEHIGIEGLPAAVPEAAALRRELQNFYVQSGFRLFGGAYSEYLHTVNAIPHILNFGVEQPWTSEHSEGAAIGQNRYFDRLSQLGYRVRVYQTDFLDLCANPAVESCTVQPAVDLKPIAATRLAATEKAELILYGFASLSEAVKLAVRFYDLAALRLARTSSVRLPLIELHQANATGALVAFDRVIADLGHARPGEAYVVHLLLPHYPYATRRDCGIKALGEWQMRGSPLVTRTGRELAYFDQVICATAKVGAALRALAASPGGSRSIVIVHGDHGSRITQQDPIVENVGRFDERDLINGYSTLFAVRGADIEPGYEATRLPVAQLLSALARSSFSSATVDLAPGFAPSVMLEDRKWKPIRRHELPTSWTSR